MTRFAVCGAICRAAWCAYNEKRFAARFAICGAVCGAANREGAYNVTALTKRRRFAICGAAEGAYNKSGTARSETKWAITSHS